MEHQKKLGKLLTLEFLELVLGMQPPSDPWCRSYNTEGPLADYHDQVRN